MNELVLTFREALISAQQFAEQATDELDQAWEADSDAMRHSREVRAQVFATLSQAAATAAVAQATDEVAIAASGSRGI